MVEELKPEMLSEWPVTRLALLVDEPYEAVGPYATSELADWFVVHVTVAPVTYAQLESFRERLQTQDSVQVRVNHRKP